MTPTLIANGPTHHEGFGRSIALGLAAGTITGATGGALLLMVFAIVDDDSLLSILASGLRGFMAVGAASAILAVFPLGPAAFVVCRHAYRRGLRSQTVFGLIGASLIAFLVGTIVIGSVIIEGGTSVALEVWWLLLAVTVWAGISGAVGAVVFARSRRQHDLRTLRKAAQHF
jgi:hypothetical protein